MRVSQIYNVEMSWLSFNWRVIYTAQQKSVPLWEQLRFLAISSGNLDEFFAKRVHALHLLQSAGFATHGSVRVMKCLSGNAVVGLCRDR